MDNEYAIKINDVYKSFRVYSDRGYSLKEILLFSKRRKYRKHQVINGISFRVKKGEAIGLVGHNGCGKSTLLKMLTRIMYPDSGDIEIKGRVSSLIELGAGFHPDMSGRENIYTNAAIFGLTKSEIDERIQSIIDFSEIEEFIDNPVRTYSSGMYMRLAFSVAINVNADILLIDEILAVGDVAFQNKCFNRLREIKSNGTTIVIVSHNLGQIEQICDRSIWINDGIIKEIGAPRDVHPAYMAYMASKKALPKNKDVHADTVTKLNKPVAADESKKSNSVKPQIVGNKKIIINNVEVFDENMNKRSCFATGDNFFIKMNYQSKSEQHKKVNVGIAIYRNDGVHCYGASSLGAKSKLYNLNKEGFIYVFIERCNLLSGNYMIDLALAEEDGTQIDYKKNVIEIEIRSTINEVGLSRIEHRWYIDNEPNEGVSDMDIGILDNKEFIEKLQTKLMSTQSCWGDKSRVHLGKNVSMVNTLYNTSSGEIFIGDNTFTGHNVCLITGTHYINKTNAERMKYPKEGRDIVIGNGVWICSNVTILGPCKVEDNVVIAAGSVVTAGSVLKTNSVYGGVPAKYIKDVNS